ncbi:MAG: phage portal protein [Dehalococcoidia bacterium]
MPELTLPQKLAQMDADRIRDYRENLDFYNGVQWLGASRRRERRLTLNYAKTFVDKITSYLMAELSFNLEPLDTSDESKERARQAELTLHEVYQFNNLKQLDFDTELDTAILGDGAYKVTWDTQEQQVRVSAPDVQGLFAWWVGDDVGRVWRVASRYKLSAEEIEQLYGMKAPTSGRNWTSINAKKESTVVEVWTASRFELWIDDILLEEKPNPYGFIPFVIYPNLREPKKFWGVSDIPAIMEPARELNRALSQLSMILELSGNPIAVLENIESAQDIAVQPGAVWELPERAKAYLLDLLQGGGVRLHTDYIDLIYRAIHDLSETPRTSFGDNRQGLSGIALEMEMNPLIQKVKRKRLIRGAVYSRRSDMILRILEQKRGLKLRPLRYETVWGSVLPQDRGRLVQEEETLVKAGIHSRRRAMDTLGVPDPQSEFQQWLEEEEKLGS